MKRLIGNMIFALMIGAIMFLLFKLWATAKDLEELFDRPSPPAVVNEANQTIIHDLIDGMQDSGANALVIREQDAPADNTGQAAAVYAADPDRAAACMQAAADGRRQSPACKQIIEALGSGR